MTAWFEASTAGSRVLAPVEGDGLPRALGRREEGADTVLGSSVVVATSVPTREARHAMLEEAITTDDDCGGVTAPWKVESTVVAAQPLSPTMEGWGRAGQPPEVGEGAGDDTRRGEGGGSWRGGREKKP